MLLSASTASVASRQTRLIAFSRPAAPSEAGQVQSMVMVRNAPSSSSEIARIFSRSALVSTGWVTSSRLCEPGIAPEQIGPRPDDRDERGHQLFADRIERRVGHLREVLMEIVVEQLRPVREHGDRLVGAHRADRDRRRPSPSVRGRTGCLPACSRTPAGDRAAPRARSTARSAASAPADPATSCSLNCVFFSHSS